ncbi:fringe, partial [Penaeus vannamei]
QRISFWFATGGAGFCISRSLGLKMMPVAGGGKFVSVGDKIRLPDDVTIGYVVEHVLRRKLTVLDEFHSHLESMKLLNTDNLASQQFTPTHPRSSLPHHQQFTPHPPLIHPQLTRPPPTTPPTNHPTPTPTPATLHQFTIHNHNHPHLSASTSTPQQSPQNPPPPIHPPTSTPHPCHPSPTTPLHPPPIHPPTTPNPSPIHPTFLSIHCRLFGDAPYCPK